LRRVADLDLRADRAAPPAREPARPALQRMPPVEDGLGGLPPTQQVAAVRAWQQRYGNRVVHQALDGGQPLEQPTRRAMERHFGRDFGQVRIHTGARAAEAAAGQGAEAFTTGRDVVFAAGRYQPGTAAGRGLLAHELTHVVQQASGVSAGLSGHRGDTHEREADRAAGDAASARRVVARGGTAPALQRQDAPADAPTAGRPTLFPTELPPETKEEELDRMLIEEARAQRIRSGGVLGPGEQAPSAPPSRQSVTELFKAMLARCEQDQRNEASRTPVRPPGGREAGPEDPLGEVSARVLDCLDTAEGRAFTARAKEVALSEGRAPLSISAYLAWVVARGTVSFPVDLGDGVELSLGLEGQLQPGRVMVTARITPFSPLLERAAKAVGPPLAAVGRGVATAAKAVAGGIWSGIKAIGRGVAAAAKAVGRSAAALGGWIWGGLKAAGRAIATAAGAVWTGIKWVAGQLWDKVTGVFRRIRQWITRLPERVGRLLLGLWEGVKALRPWSLEWWASLGRVSTWLGLLRWLGYRLVELLEIAGIGEAYETAMDFIKFNTRTLEGAEIAMARTVFGDAIDYALVRVDEGAILGPSWNDRAYTSFHTINDWGRTDPDVLIHELTHVWQYEQTGAIYMPQALHAQFWGGGYDYGDVTELQTRKAANQGLGSFNREQQAQILQDFYRLKNGKQALMGPTATNSDLPLYAWFVAQASTLTEAELIV
jgi:Domain of unknown function (DUF4157)